MEGAGELDSQVGRSLEEEVDLVLDCIFVLLVNDRMNCLDVLRVSLVNVAEIDIREQAYYICYRMTGRKVAGEQCCECRRKVVQVRKNTVAALRREGEERAGGEVGVEKAKALVMMYRCLVSFWNPD